MENKRYINLEASFTVEMALIMPFIICIIFSVFYLGFYTHDKCIMYSYCELFLEGKSDDSKDNKYDNNTFRDSLNSSLIITKVNNVSDSTHLLEDEIDVVYSVKVTVPIVSMFINTSGEVLKVKHEKYNPALLLWDKDIVKK